MWRMPAEGGPAERVSPLPGWNRPMVAPDGEGVALLHSDDRSPPELYLGGPATHPLPAPGVRPRSLGEGALLPGAGERGRGRTCTPGCSSPRNARRRGALRCSSVPSTSTPCATAGTGRWGPLMHLMVQRGYLVVQVDGRGSTGLRASVPGEVPPPVRRHRPRRLPGRGHGDEGPRPTWTRSGWASSAAATAGRWRSSPSSDGRGSSARRWPRLRPPIPATTAATTRPSPGRPPVDPEAFERGRAVPLAKSLRDHLLIIHGMADDVVPFQTSVAAGRGAHPAAQGLRLRLHPHRHPRLGDPGGRRALPLREADRATSIAGSGRAGCAAAARGLAGLAPGGFRGCPPRPPAPGQAARGLYLQDPLPSSGRIPTAAARSPS